MGKKMGYVIRDEDGNYVSDHPFTLTDEGWKYLYYTGDATGSTFWINETTIKTVLVNLKNINEKYNFNRKFHIDYIDLKTINRGESVIINAFKNENDNNNLISA